MRGQGDAGGEAGDSGVQDSLIGASWLGYALAETRFRRDFVVVFSCRTAGKVVRKRSGRLTLWEAWDWVRTLRVQGTSVGLEIVPASRGVLALGRMVTAHAELGV